MKGYQIVLLTTGFMLLEQLTTTLATTPRFQGLGDLAGGSVWSIARDISADGSTVVGDSYSASGREAFRWTKASGLRGLGVMPVENAYSSAFSVSRDGRQVAGEIRTQDYASEAFLWTEPNGFLLLGALVEPSSSHWSKAAGVSDDGSVVVGTTLTNDPTPAQVAFRWTATDGMQPLEGLPGGPYWSRAYAVSANGAVVVGYSQSALGGEAFRWSQSAGIELLGDLPGGSFASNAYAVSADGSVVVGESCSEYGWREAFRWTESGGMMGLGDLPGGNFFSEADAVSADGSIVVGRSVVSIDGRNEDEAFIWDERNGMRSIREVLRRQGLDMTGWVLHAATGISADGLTVCGFGKNPDGNVEAWIATMGPPPEPERFGTQWVAFYNGSTDLADWANDIAVDEHGCVYVAGASYKAPLDSDYLTIKYDPNGSKLWAAKHVGPVAGINEVLALAIDSQGNTWGISLGGYGACVTIKYDRNGNELWAASYDNGPHTNSYGNAIAVDMQGNVYVAGRSDSGSDPLDDRPEYLTIKYGPNGNIKWVNRYSSISTYRGASVAEAIAVDDLGNVYVTGTSGSDSRFADYATVKYDANGTEQWVARYGQVDADDKAWDIALDRSGNVYVTGESFDRAGSETRDVVTIKYSPDGDEIWVRRYDGEFKKQEQGRRIALDGEANVYVGGYRTSRCDCSNANSDYLIVKYDPNGNEMWAESYNGPGDGIDMLTDMAVDEAGNIYVTGYSHNGSDTDYTTIKYNTNGRKLWVHNHDGPANATDRAHAIAVDSEGNVYVTGGSETGRSDFDCVTIKYFKCTQSGDINCDKAVDFGDFAALANHWRDVNCGKCGWADLTDDRNVGMDDLRELADHWLTGITPQCNGLQGHISQPCR